MNAVRHLQRGVDGGQLADREIDVHHRAQNLGNATGGVGGISSSSGTHI
jgi:hypothetical protein